MNRLLFLLSVPTLVISYVILNGESDNTTTEMPFYLKPELEEVNWAELNEEMESWVCTCLYYNEVCF